MGRRARLGLTLLLVALAIAAAVTWIGAPPFDRRLVHEARSLRDGAIGDVLRWASTVGYVRWLGPITVVAGLGLGVVLHRWRDAALLALSTLTAALLNHGAKQVFERVRPSDGVDVLAAGFSMPSGHAAASSAFAASLVLATFPGRWRRIALVLGVLFAGTVGLSRVVAGVHYPTDVVAGWCLGTGVALV
ncbi:MAG: rane protein, partial [Thermoleophilia bacterium]|nr:rane protein [Thermoleophilia bacterium]